MALGFESWSITASFRETDDSAHWTANPVMSRLVLFSSCCCLLLLESNWERCPSSTLGNTSWGYNRVTLALTFHPCERNKRLFWVFGRSAKPPQGNQWSLSLLVRVLCSTPTTRYSTEGVMDQPIDTGRSTSHLSLFILFFSFFSCADTRRRGTRFR